MKKLFIAAFLTELIFISGPHLYSQKILYPEVFPLNTRIDNFETMDGTTDQASNTLMFDRKGFLWTGTETGLYRFDGVRYVEYRNKARDSTGFAGSLVSSIYEDSEGILWVGTIGALNRLDRITGRFRHYYPDPTGKMPVNNVIRLIRDGSDSTLWIKTNGNIYSFNKKSLQFTEYKTPRKSWRETLDVYGEEPARFIIDRTGIIWSATDKGLFRIDSGEPDVKVIIIQDDKNIPDSSQNVQCVIDDNAGNIWCGTFNGGLFRISPENPEPQRIVYDPALHDGDPYGPVCALLPEKDGTIWIFRNNAFTHFNPADRTYETWQISYEKTPLNWLPRYNFVPGDVFLHPDGSIWMFWRITSVMARFDRKKESLSLYRFPFGINMGCVMDSTGSFWIPCVRNNIYRLSTDLMAYSTISVNNGAWAGVSASTKTAPDKNGNIWVLLYGSNYNIQIQDPFSSPSITKLKIPGNDTLFSSVLTDSRKGLWLGGRQGKIIYFSPETGIKKTYQLEHPLINMDEEDVLLLRQDSLGNIWAATSSAGLYRLNESENRFLHVMDSMTNTQASHSFTDFLISKSGGLWVLFLDQINRLEPENEKLSDYSATCSENNLAIGYYSRIREDKNGTIWLLNSHKGLYIFDRKMDAFTPFLPVLDKLGSFCYDLLADTLGRLWIAHSEGITVYDPGTCQSRLIKINKPQWDIQGYEVSGHIVYINDNEIYLFDYDIPLNTRAPEIYITRLEINGESFEKVTAAADEISSLKEISLKHNQNFLRLELSAINFNNASENTYFYFMRGVDNDTVSSGRINFAEYKKLKPGRYTFWASAANNDGILNQTGTSIIINIEKPYYRSAIAYLLYSAILLSIVLLYIRGRLKNIRRENIRLENEVRHRTEELNIKNSQLEDADRMKTRFFTDISHEIRTPLSLIIGPLESLINENHYEPSTENLLEMMRRNGNRLMQLVTQMLDISRLDSGKMKIALSESDLTVFLRLLVYEYVSLAESRKIKYLVDLPEKPHITLFDEDKLEKILTNLLTNAFKFTSSGGTVRCNARIIPGIMKKEAEQLMVSVSDTGEGIDSKNIDRIFERYYRAEGEGDHLSDGTGVGLSLVKELVTLCHGTIDVKSKRGEGSLFEVIIPLGKDHLSTEEFIITSARITRKEKHEPEMWKDIETAKVNSEQEHDKHRIIVIEDNDDLRNYLSANLENDYSVIIAETGKEGLNLCMTLVPDLVVTDIMMKDLDGIALCMKLKNDERTSHIPVIMLTARSTLDDKLEGLKAGADDYLVKPFNFTELKTRISNLMHQREMLKHKYSNLLNIDLKENEKESVNDRFMRKVILVLNENIHNFDFNVKVLQEKLGMSRTHLFRKIKVLTGMSPVMLIRKFRMEKAARMLLNKTGNITEIANSVGISNPSYFTRCFREQYGMTPKDYQIGKER